jgi:type VI secretion system protein VasG
MQIDLNFVGSPLACIDPLSWHEGMQLLPQHFQYMDRRLEAHTVSKLKGAPPGYVGFGQGGVLTEAIRHRPYGVLLLDEVEKSHPDVQDLFLQVLDKGFLEDSEGVRVDFRNVLILLTSNASAELLQQIDDPSTWSDAERNEFEQKLHQDLIKHFRPAFLGRVSVVPYMPLNEEQIRSIIDQRLSALGDRYEKGYGQSISFGSNLVTVVVENCMNAAVGVRLVDQFISEKIVASISKHVLESMVAKRVIEAISVDYQNGEVVVHA